MEIITRKQAKERGLKRYFTGKPCKRGHIVERSTLGGGVCVGCYTFHDQKRFSDDPQKIRDKNKKWRDANPGKIARQQRRWKISNPDKRSAIQRRYYLKNKDSKLRYGKEWRLKNKDRIKETSLIWRANNKDRKLIEWRNRDARKRGNGGNHTQQDILEILFMQDNKCAYYRHCGTEITKRNQNVDHIIPIAAGGSNDRSNIQILCRPCNLAKSAKDPIIHCQSLGWLL